jgi:hypothetical protein
MKRTPTTVSTHPKITVAMHELLDLDPVVRRPTSAGSARVGDDHTEIISAE